MAKKKFRASSPLSALHPIIVAQLRYPERPTKPDRKAFQKRVRKQVVKCESCELHKTPPNDVNHPVPFHLPAHRPKFIVIGEAPGPRESERGQPFIGPAGNLFRALMHDVGIEPDDDVFWMNTVSCFPTTDGKKIRRPSHEEQRACYDNCIMQAAAAYTPYVLLVGATAFNLFRSDLNVTNHHGKFFVWNDNYVVMGIIHPASVLRGSSGYKKLIREDLQVWHDVVYGDDDPLRWLGDECVLCGGIAVCWDRDGVPWCQKHEGKVKQWESERARWTDAVAVQLTF